MELTQWFLALLRLAPPEPTCQPPGPPPLPLAIGEGQPQHDRHACDLLPYHHYNNPFPELRTSFSTRVGYVHAQAHPSIGGIVTATLSAVQLKQLGLSNLEETPRSYNNSSTSEDDFALALLAHGGHWWCSYSHYHHRHRQLNDRYIPYDYHFPLEIHVAYPSVGDGVWIIKFSIDGRVDIDEVPTELKMLPPKSDDWDARVSMALTPEDRIEVFKSFGAKYYRKVEYCIDTPESLEEGRDRGERHEELLRQLDDKVYRDTWVRRWPLHDSEGDIKYHVRDEYGREEYIY